MIDDPELGKLKQCAKCKEWWPADTEFFDKASSRKDGLHPYCKAVCLGGIGGFIITPK